MRIHVSQKIRFCGVLAAMLVLAGCGGSSSKSTSQVPAASDPTSAHQATASGTTSSQTTSTASPASASSEQEPYQAMTVRSVGKLEPIAAHYTCDGANVPPPLRWSGVPPHTAELVLLIVLAKDVSGGNLSANWGVAGLRPSSRGLSGGILPPGAVVGRNSFGETRYSICPPKGVSASYVALLFGLQHRTSAKPGFSASALAKTLLHSNVAEGFLGFTYKRR